MNIGRQAFDDHGSPPEQNSDTRRDIAFADASRRKAIEQVERDYLAFITSIDPLAPASAEAQPTPVAASNLPATPSAGSDPIAKTKRSYKKRHAASGPAGLVRQAIATMEEFSTVTIYATILHRHPDAKIEKVNIFGILNKLAKSGEIVRTFDGKLKEPNRYRKAESGALF